MANLIYGTDITSETITREQIVELRTEATRAGDDKMADVCGQALAGDEDSIRECERVIADAAAQDVGVEVPNTSLSVEPVTFRDPLNARDYATALNLLLTLYNACVDVCINPNHAESCSCHVCKTLRATDDFLNHRSVG